MIKTLRPRLDLFRVWTISALVTHCRHQARQQCSSCARNSEGYHRGFISNSHMWRVHPPLTPLEINTSHLDRSAHRSRAFSRSWTNGDSLRPSSANPNVCSSGRSGMIFFKHVKHFNSCAEQSTSRQRVANFQCVTFYLCALNMPFGSSPCTPACTTTALPRTPGAIFR